jgi:hypothetical protein
MTEQQAFKAMILFLERHFNRTQSDDMAALLGELQLLDDGLTADPAAWQEWMECVETIESKANRPAITAAR